MFFKILYIIFDRDEENVKHKHVFVLAENKKYFKKTVALLQKINWKNI